MERVYLRRQSGGVPKSVVTSFRTAQALRCGRQRAGDGRSTALSVWKKSILAALCLAASPAFAQSQDVAVSGASLSFDAPAECPSREVFQDLVVARLGYSPFGADGEIVLQVQIEAVAGRFVGALLDRQASSIESASCDEVAEALAVIVALEIDPLGEGAARSAEPPREDLPADLGSLNVEEPPIPEVVDDEPVHIESQDERGPRVFGDVSLVSTLGLAPSFALGGGFSIGLRWRYFELGLGALIETTLVSGTLLSTELDATVWRGVISGCAIRGVFRGCGLVQVGRLHARSDVVGVNSGSAALGYAGVGLYLDLPGNGVSFSFGAHALIPFLRVDLFFGEDVGWTSPLLAGGLSVTARFGRARSET